MEATSQIEENKRLVRRFPEEVATEGQLELIDEFCTPDVVDHGPLGERRGREALKEQMRYIRTAFAEFTATVDEIVGEGDVVAMRVTLRGVHEGEFMGIEPTGKAFEVQNSVFTRIENGQIAERWVQPDLLGLLRQVGAETLPQA